MITSIQEYLKENKKAQHSFPEYWYHGTNIYFEKFSLDVEKNWNQSILGIYFTQYLKPGIYGSTAKEYAEDMVRKYGGEPYIYKCKINFINPLVLDSNGWYSTVTYVDKNRYDIKNWLKTDKHDAVISYDFENYDKDGFEYADFILATDNLNIIDIIDIIKYK